jgi:hypothetical protein
MVKKCKLYFEVLFDVFLNQVFMYLLNHARFKCINMQLNNHTFLDIELLISFYAVFHLLLQL